MAGDPGYNGSYFVGAIPVEREQVSRCRSVITKVTLPMRVTNCDRVSTPTATAITLACLIDESRHEIAADWATLTYDNASFYPELLWRDTLLSSTTRGLMAISHYLATGTESALAEYLYDLSEVSRSCGFASSELIQALLLCNDAVLPAIRRAYAHDLTTGWALVSALDSCLRWMVSYFNDQYGAELNRRTREHHERIVQMLNIGQQAPGAQELDDMLGQVAEGIIAAVTVSHCDFYLVSENESELIPRLGVYHGTRSPRVTGVFLSRRPNITTDAFLREVLERKKPLTCYNAQADTRTDPAIVGQTQVKSLLAVPLVAHDRVLALAVTGTYDDYRAFTDNQIELAWDIARAAALVLENVNLDQQRLAESESVRRGVSALLRGLKLEDVLRIVCTEARRLTGAQGCSVYFLDGDELQRFFNLGNEPAYPRVPLAGSLTGMALREGKTLISNRPDDDARLFNYNRDITNMLVSPLFANDQPIGALYAVDKPRDFTDDDARVFRIFADQAAIALENARLYEKIGYLAAVEERERLAREIHDNLAQVLSVVNLQASHIGGLLRTGQVEQAQTFLADMRKLVTEAHVDARDAIFSLRNGASSSAEFLSALSAYLERCRQSYGMNVHLAAHDDAVLALPPPTIIQLTRIIQEALTNVRKHADAGEVWVELYQRADQVTVVVKDDGRGFDPVLLAKRNGGVGLQIMGERAACLGGQLEVESAPGQGTCVRVRIPVAGGK